MKVLLVSPLPPPSGGMTRWTQLYVDGVDKQKINLFIVNTSISKKRSANINRSYYIFDELSRFCSIISEFRKGINEFKPDIIHICSPCSNYGLIRDYICVLSSKKTPVIFHCHCNITDQVTNWIGNLIFKRIVKKCKKIFVLNNSSKNHIESLVNNKAVLVPNFIDNSMIIKRNNVRKIIENVVFVGHVKKRKGIAEIYQVAKELPNIIFNIYGPIMELPDGTKPDNIVLHGEISHDKVLDALLNADVFIFPSYTEGFANVMLEAMAAGLPIIATNVGANRDMIENNGGIIVDTQNSKQIVEALYRMASPTVRLHMSNWNINKLEKAYTMNKVISLIEQQYLEIVL